MAPLVLEVDWLGVIKGDDRNMGDVISRHGGDCVIGLLGPA